MCNKIHKFTYKDVAYINNILSIHVHALHKPMHTYIYTYCTQPAYFSIGSVSVQHLVKDNAHRPHVHLAGDTRRLRTPCKALRGEIPGGRKGKIKYHKPYTIYTIYTIHYTPYTIHHIPHHAPTSMYQLLGW